MSVKFGALVKSLATKMKLKLDDEKLKELFAIETEVDDTTAQAFEQNLMTEEAALANTKIRNTIKAESLNGLDAVLKELMTENEFDDAAITEINTADTSFKKTKLVAKKIAELKSAKAAATPDDKKAIQKQIDDLNKALADEKKNTAEAIKIANEAHEADLYNMGLSSKLQTKNYYDDKIPVKVHAMTAKQLLDIKLSQSGAKLVFDKATQDFKIVNAETGVDYFDTNGKKVTPDDFIDGVLAENNLLKTSTPADPNSGGGNPPIITPAGDKKDVIPGMMSTIDRQLGS